MSNGYLNQFHLDFRDKSQPLIVGSYGAYRLFTPPKLPAYCPRGRLDFQIIYATSGCGHSRFDEPENETIVYAGNIALYHPKEFQKYEYHGEDKTGVYWIHLTGNNIKNILRKYGFTDSHRAFPVGTTLGYEQIFRRIILELQECQSNYEEMMALLLHHLLIVFQQESAKEHTLKNDYMIHEIGNAITYFMRSYNREINIEEYASPRGMSVSWFIRNFKKYTGSTPLQYIISIRVSNTQTLLEATDYAVNEISRIVGYDSRLYFSRLFHELKGHFPTGYHKTKKGEIL